MHFNPPPKGGEGAVGWWAQLRASHAQKIRTMNCGSDLEELCGDTINQPSFALGFMAVSSQRLDGEWAWPCDSHLTIIYLIISIRCGIANCFACAGLKWVPETSARLGQSLCFGQSNSTNLSTSLVNGLGQRVSTCVWTALGMYPIFQKGSWVIFGWYWDIHTLCGGRRYLPSDLGHAVGIWPWSTEKF